jgi:hypothetical protein
MDEASDLGARDLPGETGDLVESTGIDPAGECGFESVGRLGALCRIGHACPLTSDGNSRSQA